MPLEQALKPIETTYCGYRMRSRLEARWAVFFDTIGIQWEYEPEGFELGNGVRYLPDFWLPQVRMFAEVKHEFTDEEKRKCRALEKITGHVCVLLDGPPDFQSYMVARYVEDADDPYCNHDVLLDCSYLHEHRFFSFTGCERRENADYLKSQRGYVAAIEASRAARFETGELANAA